MFKLDVVFIELRADLNTTGVPASPFSDLCSILSQGSRRLKCHRPSSHGTSPTKGIIQGGRLYGKEI
jgi:hypothetical protein